MVCVFTFRGSCVLFCEVGCLQIAGLVSCCGIISDWPVGLIDCVWNVSDCFRGLLFFRVWLCCRLVGLCVGDADCAVSEVWLLWGICCCVGGGFWLILVCGFSWVFGFGVGLV